MEKVEFLFLEMSSYKNLRPEQVVAYRDHFEWGVYYPVLILPTEINSNRGVKGIIDLFIPSWSGFGSG